MIGFFSRDNVPLQLKGLQPYDPILGWGNPKKKKAAAAFPL